MKLAVNYSIPTADLLRKRQIEIGLLKCPAWDDLIVEAKEIHPIYVHFPLAVGRGIGDAIDTETGQRADWKKVESLLQQTGTRFVNVHLDSLRKDFPGIPASTADPAHVEMLTERTIVDLSAVAERFGTDCVIAENEYDFGSCMMHPVLSASFIRRIIEETHCGFLLDLSHARLAARVFGTDPREYISGLPVEHIREIHVTGIQRLEGHWLEAVRRCDPDLATRCGGEWIDHMPMTEPDWDFFAWALEQISSGVWAAPQIVAFEYGGVGGLFGALLRPDTLATQVPRLSAMIDSVVTNPC
jgi:uncharacterized protein (UPF0276 family)